MTISSQPLRWHLAPRFRPLQPDSHLGPLEGWLRARRLLVTPWNAGIGVNLLVRRNILLIDETGNNHHFGKWRLGLVDTHSVGIDESIASFFLSARHIGVRHIHDAPGPVDLAVLVTVAFPLEFRKLGAKLRGNLRPLFFNAP